MTEHELKILDALEILLDDSLLNNKGCLVYAILSHKAEIHGY